MLKASVAAVREASTSSGSIHVAIMLGDRPGENYWLNTTPTRTKNTNRGRSTTPTVQLHRVVQQARGVHTRTTRTRTRSREFSQPLAFSLHVLGARCGESRSPVLSPASKEPRRETYMYMYKLRVHVAAARQHVANSHSATGILPQLKCGGGGEFPVSSHF